MNIKKIILGILLYSGFSTGCFAENFLDIYHEAYLSDPQFKAASAQWLASRETLPISIANLLPQLSALGSVTRQHNELQSVLVTTSAGTLVKVPRSANFNNNLTSYSLMLTQPIFNFGNWATVWGAEATVKQAEATYLAAIESLMLRTAQGYFNVLFAEDTLRFTVANKEAVKRLLEQTQHQYDVGLKAITDLENTKASYDQAIADEISAKKSLDDSKEKLAEITGRKYAYLAPLRTSFPLVNPQPDDSERWVKAAERQNFDLAAARFASLAARENIKVVDAGHLPTLNGGLNYNYNYNNNNSGLNDFSRAKTANGVLTLNVPIFQGGRVVAQGRQAEYQYQKALSVQETTLRSTISNISQAFLGVKADISKIQADKQLIISNASALRSTEAGYSVGTRTMVDVLQAESNYYNSQKQLSRDEYDFINQTLVLKQLAAILNVDDLKIINSWLVSSPPHNTQPACFPKKAPKTATKKQATTKTTPNTSTIKNSKIGEEYKF